MSQDKRGDVDELAEMDDIDGIEIQDMNFAQDVNLPFPFTACTAAYLTAFLKAARSSSIPTLTLT